LTCHIKRHHRENYYDCVYCPAKHRDRASYLEHLDDVHSSQKSHLCPKCGKTFFFKSEFQYHARYHKGKCTPPLQCSICKEGFHSETLLQAHESSHAGGSSMLTCTEVDCGRKFETPRQLQIHIRYIHRRRKDFPCQFPGCEKSYALKSLLRRHLPTHQLGSHECDTCGVQYRTRKCLLVHQKRKHPLSDDGELETFGCDACGKSLSNKAELRKHITRKHSSKSGETATKNGISELFICEVCNVELLTKAGLTKHSLVHETRSETSHPFLCTVCPKTFSSEETLKSHAKRTHNGKLNYLFVNLV